MTNCPMCESKGIFLGEFGKKANFRCRECGWTYQTDDTTLYMDEAAEDGEDEDEDE